MRRRLYPAFQATFIMLKGCQKPLQLVYDRLALGDGGLQVTVAASVLCYACRQQQQQGRHL